MIESGIYYSVNTFAYEQTSFDDQESWDVDLALVLVLLLRVLVLTLVLALALVLRMMMMLVLVLHQLFLHFVVGFACYGSSCCCCCCCCCCSPLVSVFPDYSLMRRLKLRLMSLSWGGGGGNGWIVATFVAVRRKSHCRGHD